MASSLTPEQLCQDVADVLDVATSSLGPDEDLFDHGLDSLRLHGLIATWRSRGVDTGYVALASEPTIADWCRMLCADNDGR